MQLARCTYKPTKWESGKDAIEVRYYDNPTRLLGWFTGIVEHGVNQRDRLGLRGHPSYTFPADADAAWDDESGCAPPQKMLATYVMRLRTDPVRGRALREVLPSYHTEIKLPVTGEFMLSWRFLGVNTDIYEWLFDRDRFIPNDDDDEWRVHAEVFDTRNTKVWTNQE